MKFKLHEINEAILNGKAKGYIEYRSLSLDIQEPFFESNCKHLKRLSKELGTSQKELQAQQLLLGGVSQEAINFILAKYL